jgi:glycosyltransferase involved in cell wall biosynthesis
MALTNEDEQFPAWICCQLGAREHYAFSRALNQMGYLNQLITDAWISPQSVLNLLPDPFLSNLRERFHQDLVQVPVKSFTSSLLYFELNQRLRKSPEWQKIIARNQWFQKEVVRFLAKCQFPLNFQPILFVYSYAALEIIRFAKSKGWKVILGQIDPGPVEEQIVQAEHQRQVKYQSTWYPAPSLYWNDWRKECSLADKILVNSPWSKQALLKIGIPAQKIDIIPLVYQQSDASQSFNRYYPHSFTFDRPMRVLFLGQAILRKGIAALLDAVELLQDQPIEFWIVGSQGIKLPLAISNSKKLHWIGPVARSKTAEYYQKSDVFLFPTLSDGFGLTQLEAQAWKLPIIVSRFCGEVVKEGVNGIILSEVTGEAIAHALMFCLNNPRQLAIFAYKAVDTQFSKLSHLQQSLADLSLSL